MKKQIKRGFTLIELLVVVVIIGILVAVALPQYQLAVMRTKFANLQRVSRTYQRAALEYIAANGGTWPTSFDDLSVEAPGGFTKATPTGSDCVVGKDMYCCLSQFIQGHQMEGITCGTEDYKLAYTVYVHNNNVGHYCLGKTTDSVATKICSSYGGIQTSFNLITPKNHQVGYITYTMPGIK